MMQDSSAIPLPAALSRKLSAMGRCCCRRFVAGARGGVLCGGAGGPAKGRRGKSGTVEEERNAPDPRGARRVRGGRRGSVTGEGGGGEGFTGEGAGEVLSGVRQVRGADVFRPTEGNTAGVDTARHMPPPRRRRPWHAQKPFARERGGLHRRPRQSWPGRCREGRRP